MSEPTPVPDRNDANALQQRLFELRYLKREAIHKQDFHQAAFLRGEETLIGERLRELQWADEPNRMLSQSTIDSQAKMLIDQLLHRIDHLEKRVEELEFERDYDRRPRGKN